MEELSLPQFQTTDNEININRQSMKRKRGIRSPKLTRRALATSLKNALFAQPDPSYFFQQSFPFIIHYRH